MPCPGVTVVGVTYDKRRALGGALAGAVAAGVWAAQQRADIALFGVRYDDTELLGKLVTRGRHWRKVGLAMHVANGAAFGAAYAVAAPGAPGPGWLKGTTAALAENFATWPLVGLVDRLHPARAELPRLSGNPAALAQATWRHTLFGALLGTLESAINAGPRSGGSQLPEHPPASSNGHGDLSRAAVRQG